MFAAVLICFIIYCCLSRLFRLYPHLLHADDIKRRKSKLDIFNNQVGLHHISHRGGAGENLENTMKAFDHAHQLGTDMFEIDIQMTKDGHAVVAHDNHLLRTCGKDIYISDTNLKDLPPLLCTQRLDFNHDFSITKEVCEADRKILTLEELFSKYPRKPVNLDVKVDDGKLCELAAKLILKYERQHLTFWGNGSHKTMKTVRAVNAHIPTYYSATEVAKLVILYLIGLLPFLPLGADLFEIPMYSLFLEHCKTFPQRARSLKRQVLTRVLDFLLTNRTLIEYLKKRGVPTYFFVLNAEHEWKRAVECGASGIMTDFPTKLKHWMKTNHIEAE